MFNQANWLRRTAGTVNFIRASIRELNSWVPNDRRSTTVQANAGMGDHQAPCFLPLGRKQHRIRKSMCFGMMLIWGKDFCGQFCKQKRYLAWRRMPFFSCLNFLEIHDLNDVFCYSTKKQYGADRLWFQPRRFDASIQSIDKGNSANRRCKRYCLQSADLDCTGHGGQRWPVGAGKRFVWQQPAISKRSHPNRN